MLGRTDNDANSGTPRFEEEDYVAFEDLLKTAEKDLQEGADLFRKQFGHRTHALRETRYEGVGLCVAVYYAIRRDEARRQTFVKLYRMAFGRKPNLCRLLRESFVFVYGDALQGAAGTDAIAIEEAVRTKVPARKIPAYIRAKGGLDKLLKAGRRAREARKQTRGDPEGQPLEVIVTDEQRSVFAELPEGRSLFTRIGRPRGGTSFVLLEIKGHSEVALGIRRRHLA